MAVAVGIWRSGVAAGGCGACTNGVRDALHAAVPSAERPSAAGDEAPPAATLRARRYGSNLLSGLLFSGGEPARLWAVAGFRQLALPVASPPSWHVSASLLMGR